MAEPELWTIEQAAEHLGVKTTGGARKLLSRYGVTAAAYERTDDNPRPSARYRADDVRNAHANRPGRGARTDLQQ